MSLDDEELDGEEVDGEEWAVMDHINLYEIAQVRVSEALQPRQASLLTYSNKFGFVACGTHTGNTRMY